MFMNLKISFTIHCFTSLAGLADQADFIANNIKYDSKFRLYFDMSLLVYLEH